jgi:hypothetical protein
MMKYNNRVFNLLLSENKFNLRNKIEQNIQNILPETLENVKTFGSKSFSSVLQIIDVTLNINKKKCNDIMHYFRFYVIKYFFFLLTIKFKNIILILIFMFPKSSTPLIIRYLQFAIKNQRSN